MAADSSSKALKKLTEKEVEVLLKRGAYAFADEGDDAARAFCETDIDAILGRSQVIVHQAAADTKGPSNR